jgi:hypothetical protein
VFKVEFPDEQLEMGKLILDKFAKYLLVPGLELDFNLNTKVVATGNDILVSLETPATAELEDPTASKFFMCLFCSCCAIITAVLYPL